MSTSSLWVLVGTLATLGAIMAKYWWQHMYYLVDSDIHDDQLMLFVKMRGSLTSKSRVLVTPSNPVQYYDRFKRWDRHGGYGGRGDYTHNAQLYRGYWVNSGKVVPEVLVTKLIRDRARQAEHKKRLEAGATLVSEYHKELLQLPGEAK